MKKRILYRGSNYCIVEISECEWKIYDQNSIKEFESINCKSFEDSIKKLIWFMRNKEFNVFQNKDNISQQFKIYDESKVGEIKNIAAQAENISPEFGNREYRALYDEIFNQDDLVRVKDKYCNLFYIDIVSQIEKFLMSEEIMSN